jgi:hypothetical protein
VRIGEGGDRHHQALGKYAPKDDMGVDMSTFHGVSDFVAPKEGACREDLPQVNKTRLKLGGKVHAIASLTASASLPATSTTASLVGTRRTTNRDGCRSRMRRRPPMLSRAAAMPSDPMQRRRQLARSTA